jgi:hypothetical protein
MDQSKTNFFIGLGTGALIGCLASYFYATNIKTNRLPKLKPKSVTLTYWKGRGLCESIRMTLACAGIKWTHVVPGFNNVSHLDQPEHINYLRTNNYLVAGQVPLLRMDGNSYVQSMATVRMLARRFELAGNTFEEMTKVDIIAEIIKDWRTSIGGSWEYGMNGFEPTEEIRDKVIKGNKKYIPIITNVLLHSNNKDKKDKKNTNYYIAGTLTITYADVLALEVFEMLIEGKHMNMATLNNDVIANYYKLLKNNTNLNNYLKSNLRLNKTCQNEIKNYIKSVQRTLAPA